MSDNVGRYQLVSGGHSRREGARFVRYKAGDDITLTEKEASGLRGRVRFLGPASVDAQPVVVAQTEIESAEKIQPPQQSRKRNKRRR